MTRRHPLKAGPGQGKPGHGKGRSGGGHGPRSDRHSDANWIWGTHPALAALANPRRRIARVLATRNAAARLPAGIAPEIVEPDALDALLPAGAVHQGVAVSAAALPAVTLEEACEGEGDGPVVVLDQLSDPQNVGAIFRTAAAFGARAVVQQDRHSPPIGGVLAKAAAGGVELVADVRVVNVARAVETLGELGYRTIGLAGEATMTLAEAAAGSSRIALVLGAEGRGLRDLVAQRCDALARIPIAAAMESLNVSNAAAIALYAVSRR
ncbi:MAG: TrmH family RNA methyltransferase [Hyphomonadaceae bacterium]